MTQIATTIEQSKKLIELGLDAATSDMQYFPLGDNKYDLVTYQSCTRGVIPAWSLSALFELLSYGELICFSKLAKDDGYLWISLKQSLPNNPLIRDNEVYPSMIDMILDRYIYPYLESKK